MDYGRWGSCIAGTHPTVPQAELEFGSTVEEYEDKVFKTSTLFRLHRYKSKDAIDRAQTEDFEYALHLALGALKSGDQVLVYAVNNNGNFFCVEKKKWSHFLELWRTQYGSIRDTPKEGQKMTFTKPNSTRYVIETRNSPKAKWSSGKSLKTYETREKAQEEADQLDEMGGCGPIRVVEYDPAKHK